MITPHFHPIITRDLNLDRFGFYPDYNHAKISDIIEKCRSKEMSFVRIRQAREEDIEIIVGMTEEAWQGVTMAQLLQSRHGVLGQQQWFEYKHREIESFCRKHLDKVLVAEENGEITGYATYSLDEERAVGTAGNNAVKPEHRGKGVGSALHKAVLQKMRDSGMKIAVVTTMERDLPARRMYEKHGFREIARSIHYSQELN